jgi:hypothetical protein
LADSALFLFTSVFSLGSKRHYFVLSPHKIKNRPKKIKLFANFLKFDRDVRVITRPIFLRDGGFSGSYISPPPMKRPPLLFHPFVHITTCFVRKQWIFRMLVATKLDIVIAAIMNTVSSQ